MKKLCNALFFVLGGLALVTIASKSSAASAQPSDRVAPLNLIAKYITLPNVKGRIDHFTVDDKRKRLFVSAVGNDSVEVVNVVGGTDIKSITGFDSTKTPLYIPAFDQLWVLSTMDSKVRIFDGGALTLRRAIDLPGDFEMLRYDPTTKRVYIGWGDPEGHGGIAVFDPATDERVHENFNTGASPESFVVEKSGSHIYANVPDAGNLIESIDRNTGEIEKWPIKGASKNIAMAFDEADHRLFSITRDPALMLVFNTETGQEVARVPVAGDCADMFYDEARKRVYVIGGYGYINVIQQKGPNAYEQIEEVPTLPGVRSGYFDPKRGLLYVGVQPKGNQPAEIWEYEPQN